MMHQELVDITIDIVLLTTHAIIIGRQPNLHSPSSTYAEDLNRLQHYCLQYGISTDTSHVEQHRELRALLIAGVKKKKWVLEDRSLSLS